MASSATETVVSFTHGGESYEVDHLGICRPDTQWGEFAVYRSGCQVGEFALPEAMLRTEFQPKQLPVSDAELTEMAIRQL